MTSHRSMLGLRAVTLLAASILLAGCANGTVLTETQRDGHHDVILDLQAREGVSKATSTIAAQVGMSEGYPDAATLTRLAGPQPMGSHLFAQSTGANYCLIVSVSGAPHSYTFHSSTGTTTPDAGNQTTCTV